MIDPLNPPWQSTLPPFLQRETPPDAVQPTPETDPRGDVREPDSWIPKDHPDVIQLYERREEIDRVVAQFETVAIDVPWHELSEDGRTYSVVKQRPDAGLGRIGSPDRRIQRTVYRGTGRRITNGCRWGRRHGDDPGDYHQTKLLWPEEQSETVACDIIPNEVRVGPPDRRDPTHHNYDLVAVDRRYTFGRRERDSIKPCGCTKYGFEAQECVQCAPPLTAGGGVVQENSNSALKRKIRAEIIEEVTRFLTGDV